MLRPFASERFAWPMLVFVSALVANQLKHS
jgi:hypothetical protein